MAPNWMFQQLTDKTKKNNFEHDDDVMFTIIRGTEVGDAAKVDAPTTDRQNKKKPEIFKNFQATTCNESLQSPSPSLTGFNIQASVMKIVTSERGESP